MHKIGELLTLRIGYAAFIAFLCSLLLLAGLPFGFLAIVIVGFITLNRGALSGLFVLAWVALPALALLYLHRISMIDTVLVESTLMWLFAYVLRRLGSWRWVFEISMLIGVLVVIGLHIVFPDIQAWWIVNIKKYLLEMSRSASWHLTAAQMDNLVKELLPIATGVVVLGGLFWIWLMLMLARWWQTSIYSPGRLRYEFINIRNRPPIAIIVLVGTVGFVVNQPTMIDLFPVLLYPLVMGGLSFLHYLARIKKGFLILVILSYVGLLLWPATVVIAMLLAAVGFLDTWINGRKFLKMKGEVA